MLRKKDLIPALRMARAVGERVYGHFDHDANCVSGPGASSTPAAPTVEPATAALGAYQPFEDPFTGEVLYRLASSGSS